MEKIAGEVRAGYNGVMGIFSNLMNAKRWIHASPAFLQFDVGNPANSGRKECIRAIEESAAYVAYGHMQIIESLTGLNFSEIVFTSAPAQATLRPQMLADHLTSAATAPNVSYSTSLG